MQIVNAQYTTYCPKEGLLQLEYHQMASAVLVVANWSGSSPEVHIWASSGADFDSAMKFAQWNTESSKRNL